MEDKEKIDALNNKDSIEHQIINAVKEYYKIYKTEGSHSRWRSRAFSQKDFKRLKP